MIYLGVDPGKAGAIAALEENGTYVSAVPFPIIHSTQGRDQYDLAELARYLAAWAKGGCCVTCEKLQALPPKMGGGETNFARGYALGIVEATCAALRTSYQLVSSRRWQDAMLADVPGEDTKQRSILAAARLFPGVDLRRSERCRKLDDGLADALLIAEWGRRQRLGVKAA